MLLLIIVVGLLRGPQAAAEAPTAEVAKRCLHYAYIVYPWKRPGAAPMSGNREAWFRDCLAKNGDVLMPEGPAKPQTPPAATPIGKPANAANSMDPKAPSQAAR